MRLTGTSGVNDTFGNPLVIEMRDPLAGNRIVDRSWSPGTSSHRGYEVVNGRLGKVRDVFITCGGLATRQYCSLQRDEVSLDGRLTVEGDSNSMFLELSQLGVGRRRPLRVGDTVSIFRHGVRWGSSGGLRVARREYVSLRNLQR